MIERVFTPPYSSPHPQPPPPRGHKMISQLCGQAKKFHTKNRNTFGPGIYLSDYVIAKHDNTQYDRQTSEENRPEEQERIIKKI
jgi:hypothetical protein